MGFTYDRSLTITFSVKQSSLEKLEALVKATEKNRSELLGQWIDVEYQKTLPPQPLSLDEELDRR